MSSIYDVLDEERQRYRNHRYGRDYYTRQASIPSGTKLEEFQTEDDTIFTAQPVATYIEEEVYNGYHSDDDLTKIDHFKTETEYKTENVIDQAKNVIDQAETDPYYENTFTEKLNLFSKPDHNYNIKPVSNIYKISTTTRQKMPKIEEQREKVPTTVKEVTDDIVLSETAVNLFKQNFNDELPNPTNHQNLGGNSTPNHTKSSENSDTLSNPIILTPPPIENNQHFNNSSSDPIKTQQTSNNTTSHSVQKTPTFERLPPTFVPKTPDPTDENGIGEKWNTMLSNFIIGKKSDNTLIKKIYSNPAVRSFALQTRSYILPALDDNNNNNNNNNQKVVDKNIPTNETLTRQFSTTSFKNVELPKKNTVNEDYGRHDSELNFSLEPSEEDWTRDKKKDDEIITEMRDKRFVRAQLSHLTKSNPNLASRKVKNAQKLTRSVSFKEQGSSDERSMGYYLVSVKELRRKFEQL